MLKVLNRAKYELNGVDITNDVESVHIISQINDDSGYIKIPEAHVQYRDGSTDTHSLLDFKVTIEEC